jgi:hypothetical protein
VDFLNKKNSLTLKQLFVLHGNPPDFLYAPPLNAGISSRINIASLVRVIYFNERSDDSFTSTPKKDKVPMGVII